MTSKKVNGVPGGHAISVHRITTLRDDASKRLRAVIFG